MIESVQIDICAELAREITDRTSQVWRLIKPTFAAWACNVLNESRSEAFEDFPPARIQKHPPRPLNLSWCHKVELDRLRPIGYIGFREMRINFYHTPTGRSPVEDFIESLPKPDRARFAEVLVGLKEFGLSYARVTFKPLRGKLWEIKFHAAGGGYRMVYVIVDRDEMVILHSFKKNTNKTPLRDLDLAERRMKEVLGL